MMGKIYLVIGGARSGKSTFAESFVMERGKEVTYIATAQCLDEEMLRRVRLHRERRPAHWRLIEEPFDLTQPLKLAKPQEVIMIDCLTIYISNLLLQQAPDPDAVENWAVIEQGLIEKLDIFVQACQTCAADVVIVSNEVGFSLVPPFPLGRVFRDVSGLINQRLGKIAASVYLVVAGIPVDIKKLAGF